MATQPETCYRHPTPTLVHCTRCGRPICPDCMEPAPVGHHCPVCVAEGRREMRKRRVSLRRPASIAMTLIAVNVAVFLIEFALGGPNIPVLVQMGAMVPSLVAGGDYWRLLAAMFLHATVLHLLFNAIGLYIFGSMIEGVLGRLRFLAIFFITGISASAASFAFGSPLRVAVGASGGVFGLLGAWLAYNWRRRESGLAQANIRGGLLLIGLNLLLGLSVPGIDNTAHVAGLVAGFAVGLTAEGFGPRTVRAVSQVAGFALPLAAAVSLVAWRVDALTA